MNGWKVLATMAMMMMTRGAGGPGLRARWTGMGAVRLHRSMRVDAVKAIPSTPQPKPKTPRRRPPSRVGTAFGHVEKKTEEPDRPFTLPPGQFRPKQSLGQNYLSDQNYVVKFVEAFRESREKVCPEDANDLGHHVVEIGPGTGALTRTLFPLFPKMTAIEIDQRAVSFLADKLPTLPVLHCDALQFDWTAYAASRGGRVSIVANLPYYVVSQVLFSLADAHESINTAVVTMQWEVAERITARPRSKDYGIPSVVFQLYGHSQLLFKIPPKVFFPPPKVDSALVSLDFTKPHPELRTVYPDQLRKVVSTAFRQRRKMIRQSLKDLVRADGLSLSEHWACKRPEELSPAEFLCLTRDLYAGQLPADGIAAASRVAAAAVAAAPGSVESNTNTKDVPFLCDQKLGAWRGALGTM